MGGCLLLLAPVARDDLKRRGFFYSQINSYKEMFPPRVGHIEAVCKMCATAHK